jgi:hypothetical protein
LTPEYYIQEDAGVPDTLPGPGSIGSRRISRRRFGHDVAFAAALPLSLPQLLAEPHYFRYSSSAPSDLTQDQEQELEVRLANIVRKYGSRLSQEQRQHLRHILTYNEKMLASVRVFHLQNGDPPASVLRVALVGESRQVPEGDHGFRVQHKEGRS